MNLKIKRIAGLVRSREQIDRTLRSQGFVCRPSHPPVYAIRIEDSASGHVYRLRIPTQTIPSSHTGDPTVDTLMKLGQPSIDRSQRSLRTPLEPIPDSIVDAANHMLAEIVSYLSTFPDPKSIHLKPRT